MQKQTAEKITKAQNTVREEYVNWMLKAHQISPSVLRIELDRDGDIFESVYASINSWTAGVQVLKIFENLDLFENQYLMQAEDGRVIDYSGYADGIPLSESERNRHQVSDSAVWLDETYDEVLEDLASAFYIENSDRIEDEIMPLIEEYLISENES